MTGLVAHEWIEQHGGAEKVLDVMMDAYPDADMTCLWNDAPDRYPKTHVSESFLASTPLRGKKALALPLMHRTWRRTRIDKYDWVLISSHLFAHHIGSKVARREIPLYVYAHTPARYIWTPHLDRRGQSAAVRLSAPALRRLDRRVANEGAQFAANSGFVQNRIAETWQQESRIIYPPVAIERLQSVADWSTRLDNREAAKLESLPDEFVLGASRFVEYKDLPRVIGVGESAGLPVVLAGSGPELGNLQERAKNASVPVFFIDRPTDEFLYALYQKALIFVFPPIEDFGIMPVEAMALGTPVLVNKTGGASESAAAIGGGLPLPEGDASDIRDAISRALSLDMRKAQSMSRMFSEEAFKSNLYSWMQQRPPGVLEVVHSERAEQRA